MSTPKPIAKLFTPTQGPSKELPYLKYLGKLYEHVAGHDITEEDPKLTIPELRQIMREYDELYPEQPFKQYNVY
jgi:hypothetical protein